MKKYYLTMMFTIHLNIQQVNTKLEAIQRIIMHLELRQLTVKHFKGDGYPVLLSIMVVFNLLQGESDVIL
ncbi:hypothetical protein D3C80_1534130 [compost metagenome]